MPEKSTNTSETVRKVGLTAVLTLFFTIFCMIGRRFDTRFEIFRIAQGTSAAEMAKEFLIIFGILFLSLSVLLFLKTALLRLPFWKGAGSSYCRKLSERPFLTSFFTLLIGYCPYIFISFPTVFMGDDWRILGEGFGTYPLLTHHPVVFTVLLSNLLKLFHGLTHSWNAAAFIYSLLQLLLVIAVLSYGITLLVREAGVKCRLLILLLAFYIVSPVVSNYMFMMTKDVPYAVFLCLYGQCLFCVLKHGWTVKNGIGMSLSCIGVYLFRNEGLYVILLSLLAAILTNRMLRKNMKYCFCMVLLLHVLLTRIAWPSLGIGEGSKREMLSIPVLQTARFVKECPEDVSPEEEAVLLAAFSFNSLEEMASAYNPNISDSIKNRFVKDVSSEAAKNYFKVWISMGKRRPDIYIDAFMANNYQYFFPSLSYESYSYAWSEDCIPLINEVSGADYHYPARTAPLREAADYLRDTVFRTTPYSVLNNAGIVTWALFAAFFGTVFLRKRDCLHLLVPLFVIMAICLASPCNGYYSRYQYPIQLYLPWVWLAISASAVPSPDTAEAQNPAGSSDRSSAE